MKAAPGAYGKRRQTGDRAQGFLTFYFRGPILRDIYVRIVTARRCGARCVRKRTFA